MQQLYQLWVDHQQSLLAAVKEQQETGKNARKRRKYFDFALNNLLE